MANQVTPNPPFRRGNGNIIPKQIGLSVQNYDSGLPFNGGGNLASNYSENTTGAIGSLAIGDPNNGSALGAYAFANAIQTDTAATFVSADTIDVTGIDLTALTPPVAVASVTTAFISGSILWIKQSDVVSDEKAYVIAGLANGSTTNSRAILIDPVTGAPASLSGTAFTVYIANQGGILGVSPTVSNGPSNAVLGFPGTGDGTQPLFATLSDSGSYSDLYAGFNVGDLTASMLQLTNFGPFVGANADVPYLAFGAAGGVNPDNADIWFVPRSADPTTSVTIGPVLTISFTNGGGGDHTISGAGFLAAGFRPNTTCTVSGASNPSNNGSKRITAVSATTLTIDSSETIVNESAGASVTIVDTLIQPGGMWYNNAAGVYKYINTTGVITTISSGATDLQTAYNGGNDISISTYPVSIHATGIPYGAANSSPFILETQGGPSLGSLITRIIGGQNGPPYWTSSSKLLNDTAITFPAVGTITAGTIAFVDSNPDTITDSGLGFVAAGFTAGDKVTISGTTGALNDGVFTINTVAAGTLTLVSTDSVVAQIAGPNVTITAFSKIEFGAGVNLATQGVSTIYNGDTVTVNPASVAIKLTDISPTDEGDNFGIIKYENGAGTNSLAQVQTLAGTDYLFTATSGTAIIYALNSYESHASNAFFLLPHRTGVQDFFSIFNDSGTAAQNLFQVFNTGVTSLSQPIASIQNTDASGGADVTLLQFLNSADAGDVVWSNRVVDPTTPASGEMWFNTVAGRQKIRVGAVNEEIAFLTDVTGGGITDTTVGPSGADYTTLGAAITAGATKIRVIGNTTEVGDIALPDNLLVFVDSGVTVTMGDNIFTYAGSASIAFIGSGRTSEIDWTPTVTKTLFDIGNTADFLLRDLSVDNNATVAVCRILNSASNYHLENLVFNLPNFAQCGIRPIAEEGTVISVEFIGGGTSCSRAIESAQGHLDNITFNPTFSSVVEVIDGVSVANWSNLDFNIGVAAIAELSGRVNNVGSSTTLTLKLLVSSEVSNINTTATTLDLNGSSSNRISNCNLNSIAGMSGDNNQLSNIQVSANTTYTFSGNNNQVTNFRTLQTSASTNITGDRNVFTNFFQGSGTGGGGGTITVDAAADRTTLIGVTTDNAIVDNGTNTAIVAEQNY